MFQKHCYFLHRLHDQQPNTEVQQPDSMLEGRPAQSCFISVATSCTFRMTGRPTQRNAQGHTLTLWNRTKSNQECLIPEGRATLIARLKLVCACIANLNT